MHTAVENSSLQMLPPWSIILVQSLPNFCYSHETDLIVDICVSGKMNCLVPAEIEFLLR